RPRSRLIITNHTCPARLQRKSASKKSGSLMSARCGKQGRPWVTNPWQRKRRTTMTTATRLNGRQKTRTNASLVATSPVPTKLVVKSWPRLRQILKQKAYHQPKAQHLKMKKEPRKFPCGSAKKIFTK